MIEKNLKTKAGKLTIKIPEHLHEVTLGQLMAMQAAKKMSDLDAIHILAGTPMEDLQNITDFNDLAVFSHHIIALSAKITEAYNSVSLPINVTFSANNSFKKVKVITNLSIEPAGAYFAAREAITDEIAEHIKQYGETDWKVNFNPSLKTCAMILAHYFYCPATGNRYNEYHAEQFLDEVKKLPFTDALPIAKYFFLNYPNLWKPKISCWLRLQLCWKKRLELNRFKNSGMLTQ